MSNDIDIPPPPNALVVAMHLHTQKCMGIVTVAYDASGCKVPMWARDKIASYQLWDGATFIECPRQLCQFRWHII